MKLKHIYTLTLLLTSLATPSSFMSGRTSLLAQNPTPAPEQSEKIAVSGATLHLGNGQVVENGLVLLEDGKIEYAGSQKDHSPNDYQMIDAAGKHVYPGLIALNTGLGLTEIGAVRSTRDGRETGYLNPHVRTLIAFNTDSQVIPTVRSRGVLLAQSVPQGGRISGKSSIFQLDGWNYEDAVRRTDDGIHLNWPRTVSYSWRERKYSENKDYNKQLNELEAFMLEAKAYCNGEREGDVQLKLAAMCDLLNNDANAYVHVYDAKGIQSAVMLMKEFGIKPVIVGGDESYLVADFLKQEGVSVILGSTQDLPNRADADIDQPFKTPAMLAEAGVSFAISHGGYWEQRNLPFVAGTAVAYGLDYEKAIQALTLDAAKIAGIDQDYGSLENGKSATLIVVGGDLLDMRKSEVEMAFIDGRMIDLDNKQSELYRKFKEKYSRESGR
ncbi:hypothetical protein CEQ90_11210 [Lewinellaceae bacterium SD302]|nr:hypothetical protein CEQ90_11210 [Lewinellaceae bacterium SD302]